MDFLNDGNRSSIMTGYDMILVSHQYITDLRYSADPLIDNVICILIMGNS